MSQQRQIPGQQQAPKTVSGSSDAVPCPHCGKKNDLRDLQQQNLFDTGHRLFCDHCGHSMEVVAIRPTTVVSVRKDPKPRHISQTKQHPGERRMAPPQRQVAAPPPTFMQKLLGTGPKPGGRR